MSSSGKSLVSALILAVAVALMAPVFIEAGGPVEESSWQYAEYFGVLTEYMPLLLVAGAALLLADAIRRQSA